MQNINLIRKIAWYYHKQSKHDWNDLFQEAYLSYARAMKNYCPTKGSIKTYVWHYMYFDLKEYLDKEQSWNKPLVDLKEATKETTNRYSFWDSIPEELMEPVNLILKYSGLLDCIFKHKQITKEEKQEAQEKVQTLLFQSGRDNHDVQRIIHKLKQVLV